MAFSMINSKINENLSHCDKEITVIDEDFHSIGKNFSDISQAAANYLKDQIKKPWLELNQQKKGLEEKFLVVEAKIRKDPNLQEPGLRNELQCVSAEIDKFCKVIDFKAGNPMRYRASEYSRQLFGEIMKLFYRNLKNMYRKFKIMLEDKNRIISQTDLKTTLKEMEEGKDVMNNLINSLKDQNDEKKMNLLQNIVNQTKMMQNKGIDDYLAHPSQLKKLNQFPDFLSEASPPTEGPGNDSTTPTSEQKPVNLYRESIKRYGDFNLPKNPHHESFVD